jgi:hypothetical protein
MSLDKIELLVARELNRVLKTICIGRPGERYPSSDILRIYVDDELWQSVIEDLAKLSSPIIIRVGSSEGLSWEIDLVLQKYPEKTFLFFCQASGAPLWGGVRGSTSLDEAIEKAGLSRYFHDTELPPNAYFCTFDNRLKPIFLATSQQTANQEQWLRESIDILINHLLVDCI